RRAGEWQASDRGDAFCKRARELRRGVESGADSSAALRQWIKMAQAFTQSRDAVPDLGRVAGEFLTQRQRRGVLGMGAADFHDFRERTLLLDELTVKFGERWDQLGRNCAGGCDVHRSRKAVVRRLAHVDVVVRMHRRLRAEL